jgi:cytochrome c556
MRQIAVAGIALAVLVSWPMWELQSANKVDKILIPPKLSGLIQEEMKVIARALNEIVQAVVIGEHRIVAEQSRIIHQSFVLEHSGDSEETDKLIASLPQAFVALDRKLHRSAKKLAEAARGQKIDTERYYLSEMIENCVQCHKLFATHRFPSLGK